MADTARRLNPDLEITFVGEPGGLADRLVPAAGYRLRTIEAKPLPRRPSLQSVGALLTLAAALPRAATLLHELAPQAVVGTGGYASACILLVAGRRRLSTLLIELNAVPGRTTRLLSRQLGCVCLQFPEARSRLPDARCELTGSPVRVEFHRVTRSDARRELGLADEEFCLLVFGGSQAAASLNRALTEALPRLVEDSRPSRVYHLCGENFLPRATVLRRRVPAMRLRYEPSAYRADVWTLMAAADLVVCRAGGSSLAELALLGRPAILVPYPYAADDHQTRNAAHFAALNAAVVIRDAELSAPRLAAEIRRLRDDPDRRTRMGRCAREASFPRAAQRILDLAGVVPAGHGGPSWRQCPHS